MTRGVLAIVIDEKYFVSQEFNGDMNPEVYGKKAIKKLAKCKDMIDFRNCVNKFNSKYFDYEEPTPIYMYANENEFLSHIEYCDYTYLKKKNTVTTLNFGKDIKLS